MTGYRTPLVQVVSLLILLRIEMMAFYFLFGFVFIAIYTKSHDWGRFSIFGYIVMFSRHPSLLQDSGLISKYFTLKMM
jgi:hypothetical protein